MAFEGFTVGRKVKCVSAGPWHNFRFGERIPHVGGTYTIREVCAPWGEYTTPSLRFEELVNPKHEYSSGYDEAEFDIEHFRLLVSEADDMEMFNHLLNPTPLEILDRLMEIMNEQ